MTPTTCPRGRGLRLPGLLQAPRRHRPVQAREVRRGQQDHHPVRNDDYWGEKAKTAKITFKVIPDETTRRQELKAGSIDGYDLPNPVDWKGLKDDGNNLLVRPAFNILYLGLNPEKNPKLKDLKVRQALYYALNREQLVKTQLPEGADGCDAVHAGDGRWLQQEPQPYAYDPEKAKSLLKEAGAEGMTLDVRLPL